MSSKMIARRTGQMAVDAASDDVIFGVSLPGDTVVTGVRAEMHITNATFQPAANAFFYMGTGYILPVFDPDAGDPLDTIFDSQVPKDIDPAVFNLDTTAADSSPFSEPGEIDFANMVDVGIRPQRIWEHRKMLTVANASTVILDTSMKYAVNDVVGISINRRYRVEQPSVLVFVLGSPAMDDTTSNRESALLEAEWSQVKYIEMVLERALMDLLGLAESGAETPWEEAVVLLQKQLEPDVMENSAGVWGSLTYSVFSDALIGLEVPGEFGKLVIDTGR